MLSRSRRLWRQNEDRFCNFILLSLFQPTAQAHCAKREATNARHHGVSNSNQDPTCTQRHGASASWVSFLVCWVFMFQVCRMWENTFVCVDNVSRQACAYACVCVCVFCACLKCVCVYMCMHVHRRVFEYIYVNTSVFSAWLHQLFIFTAILCFNFGRIMHLPLQGLDEIVLCFLFHSLSVVLSLKKGAHPKNVHVVQWH